MPMSLKPQDVEFVYYKGEENPPEGVPVGLWALEHSVADGLLESVLEIVNNMPLSENAAGNLLDDWNCDGVIKLSEKQFFGTECACYAGLVYRYLPFSPDEIAHLYKRYLSGEGKAAWRFPPAITDADADWLFYGKTAPESIPEGYRSVYEAEKLLANAPDILKFLLGQYLGDRSAALLAFEHEGLVNQPEGVKFAVYSVARVADCGSPSDNMRMLADFLSRRG